MRRYMNDKYNNSDEYKRYNSILKKVKYKLKNDVDFRNQFELKFYDNISWENQSVYWEVDHIISAIKMIKNGYTDDEINDIRNIRPLKISENRERIKMM